MIFLQFVETNGNWISPKNPQQYRTTEISRGQSADLDKPCILAVDKFSSIM